MEYYSKKIRCCNIYTKYIKSKIVIIRILSNIKKLIRIENDSVEIFYYC